QADAATVHDIPQRVDDALDARVIRCDPVAHEPVWRGKLLEDVDRDVETLLGLEQGVRGVDARGPRADHGESQCGHNMLLTVHLLPARRGKPARDGRSYSLREAPTPATRNSRRQSPASCC